MRFDVVILIGVGSMEMLYSSSSLPMVNIYIYSFDFLGEFFSLNKSLA